MRYLYTVLALIVALAFVGHYPVSNLLAGFLVIALPVAAWRWSPK